MEQQKLVTEQQLEVDRVKRSRQVFKKQFALLRYFNHDESYECDGRGCYQDEEEHEPCPCEILGVNRCFNNDLYQVFMLLHHLFIKISSKESHGGILSTCNLHEIATLLDKFERFTKVYSNRVTHYLEISIHEDQYAKVLALLPPRLKAFEHYLLKKSDAEFEAMIEKKYLDMCDRYAI